ncbi:b6d67184-aada-411e-aaca-bdb53252f52a [Sclerotinia trifoliorum]|uniref:B6d67184-aada-411e-aaca-bdb53252f52a n=1 Tax=Sclerotinia trifoliorum TaxID=28548 RepID=A0A8H2VXJ2_9HELO|nr:b6d67184-aada-411e-aaca-bdb53252f52a [Sclerotinia trifoliorum]
METPKMVQRSHLSSAANHFLNSPVKSVNEYVEDWFDAYELREASPAAPCLGPRVPPAPSHPYRWDFDWKSAKSARVELEVRGNVELAELQCLDEQMCWSSQILARDDVDDKTTTDLLPPSNRSRRTKKEKIAAGTDCTNSRTPRDPSQPNLTSDTRGKNSLAHRTPLPSGPTPQKYKWLVRRLYCNRPMSQHSGSFSDLKLKLDIARNMTEDQPGKFLRRRRRTINREVKLSCPRLHPITVGQNPSMMGGELPDTGGGIRRMNEMIREGPDGQGWGTVADLEERKDRKNDLQCKKSIKNKVREHLRKAARLAHIRRARKSSYCVRTMDRYFNQLKEAAGADFLKRGKHCLSAKPWYMLYYHKYEVAPGKGLTGASSGVRKKRPGFKYDPHGARSSLRMVTNVDGNVDEYVHAIETDLPTLIQSIDDEFNESSESTEEESIESSEEESEEDW